MNTLRRLQTIWLWTPAVATIFAGCFAEDSSNDSEPGSAELDKPVLDTVARTRYEITDLGINNSKDNFSMAMGLNQQGWAENMDGTVSSPETSTSATVARGRAVISIYGFNIDLGTLGKPDANSWINWGGINDRGEAVGMSETADLDPNGEDLCAFGTHLTCVPFLWRAGHMTALPTAGGNNGQASAINNRSEVVGYAETADADPTCPPVPIDVPMLWESDREAHVLPLVGTDPDGVAFGINDRGQAVGYSGDCSTAAHAVRWTNNTVTVLEDLGVERSNIAYVINNRGQTAGQVRSADNTTFVAALWDADGNVTSLGVLPGQHAAFATGINDRGQVVGNNFDAEFNWSRGFLWQNGAMTDINSLIPSDSNLFVISASNINDRGQISGMGIVQRGPHAGDIHAFVATPVEGRVGRSVADVATTHPAVANGAGKQMLQLSGRGRFAR